LANKLTGDAAVSQLHLAIPNLPVASQGGSGKTGQDQGFGSARTPFRPQLDRQLVLLPVGQPPLLPEDHFVFFMIDIVGSLDLSAFLAKHERKSRVGRPAYNPVVMLTLILLLLLQWSYVDQRYRAALQREHTVSNHYRKPGSGP